MKRRDFMKLLGVAAITPVALLRAKPKTHPVDVLIDLGLPNGKLTAEMREYCDEKKFGTTSMRLDGKGKWHHCVVDIPWNKPSKIYINGEQYKSVVFESLIECLSFSF